jgi:hypothetical protein
MADAPKSRRSAAARPVRHPTFAQWSKKFLAELANTSNVTASAKHAGIVTSTAYDRRRVDPEFNRDWQRALCEGYDNLEMDLLRRLREGEIKPAAGAKKGVRTWDNAVALRLLGAHKDSATRQRGMRSHEDSEAILQAINDKLRKIHDRRLAAEQAAGSTAATLAAEQVINVEPRAAR